MNGDKWYFWPCDLELQITKNLRADCYIHDLDPSDNIEPDSWVLVPDLDLQITDPDSWECYIPDLDLQIT